MDEVIQPGQRVQAVALEQADGLDAEDAPHPRGSLALGRDLDPHTQIFARYVTREDERPRQGIWIVVVDLLAVLDERRDLVGEEHGPIAHRQPDHLRVDRQPERAGGGRCFESFAGWLASIAHDDEGSRRRGRRV